MKDELKAIVQYTGKYNLHNILIIHFFISKVFSHYLQRRARGGGRPDLGGLHEDGERGAKGGHRRIGQKVGL